MLAEQQALLWLCESADGGFINRQFGPLAKSNTFDWSIFFKLANRHGLVPLAHRNSSMLLINIMPKKIKNQLKKQHQSITIRNLQIINECLKLQKLCQQIDIPITFIKGATLAIQLYGDPALRCYCDCDFLVDKTNLDKLNNTLINSGLHAKHRLSKKARAYQLNKGKDLPYYTNQSKLLIEAHWRLTYYQPWLNSLMNTLEKHSHPIYWKNHQFQSLEKHIYCCYLAYHGSFSGWAKLKWLTDFYHCYRQCDHQTVIHYSQQFNVEAFVEHAILFAHKLFQIKSTLNDPQKKSTIKSTALASILSTPNKKSSLALRIIKYRFYLSLTKGFSEKKHVLLHCFFSPEAQAYEINLPDKLFFLYFIVRPFHWIYKYSLKPLLRS